LGAPGYFGWRGIAIWKLLVYLLDWHTYRIEHVLGPLLLEEKE